MFPIMNKEGMMGAISHYVYDQVNIGIALGHYRGHKIPKERAKNQNVLSKKGKK